jgi:hypothetical protein
VTAARSAGPVLDALSYTVLRKPSEGVAPFTYREVSPDLFTGIFMSGMSGMRRNDPMWPTRVAPGRAEK